MTSPLIVFDLDGTLSDSQQAIVSTFQAVAPALRADDITPMIGLSLDKMFARLVPGGDVPALVAGYRAAYLEHDARHTKLFPGIASMLFALQGRGLRLAVATSKRQRGAEASVGRLGITGHFDLIVGDAPERRGKPHPDMLEHVLRTLGADPQDAIMVGDTTFDLQMARAAGVYAIGVSWGMHGAARLAPFGPVASDATGLHGLISRQLWISRQQS